eukprot:TRINITY_DN9007_c0_g1_i1.p1 TRINITY_DN9007_c0_g1~~TRINITY_DN9007_c0_g1_i1.p1  ORF type:complete len:460 (+),score=177.59 TRINITY_DN9007_c0_g1_i1:90-1382(+)
MGAAPAEADATAGAAAGEAPGADPGQLIRSSPEYAAAWELELWKRQQQTAFARRLEEERRRATAAHAEQLQMRAKEQEREHQRRMQALGQLDERRERDLEAAHERRQQLQQCEQELRRRREDIERERLAAAAECEARLRRGKEEASHRVAMEQLKQRQLEHQNKELAARLEDAERRYQKLWDDFADFKHCALTRPHDEEQKAAQERVAAAHKEELAALRREHGAREDRMQRQLDELREKHAKLREKYLRAQQAGAAARKELERSESDRRRLTAELAAAAQELQLRPRGRESPAPRERPVGGDAAGGAPSPRASDLVPPPPEQQQQPQQPRVAHGRDPEMRSGSPPPLWQHCDVPQQLPAAEGRQLTVAADPTRLSPPHRARWEEAQRVLGEMQRLLGTGCYRPGDPLIVQLELRCDELLGALPGAAAESP